MRLLMLPLVVVMVVMPAMLARPPVAMAAAPQAGTCIKGTLPEGALSLICVPAAGWNGDLVVWAHGYVPVNEPLDFYNLTLPGSAVALPDLVQSLGFAFATTSYRANGLVVIEGIQDIRNLAMAFKAKHGAPHHTYLAGASQGGVITTLAVERYPQLFSGGLALCGPIGDFGLQSIYLGNFRFLFQTLFPGVLPTDPRNPTRVPQIIIDHWDDTYVPAVKRALANNPGAAQELMKTSQASFDVADPATVTSTTLNLLQYNVFATNNAAAKLGGNPFDNRAIWYTGSSNDILLNLLVPRVAADPKALRNLRPYQSAGGVTIPLVTMHTTSDDVIPFWHEILYSLKPKPTGRGSLTQIPIFRYGHCQFTVNELLGGFGLLVLQVTNQPVKGIAQQLDPDKVRRDFARASAEAKGGVPAR